ncbi:sortase A [Anaerovirgula multivorans]|uniref:Sortase A n=1 Tax=Anaerovirgula multivorans TaxID=312168 RepID=A0A239GQ79_9FIRM|nr:class D sortase [Anaerovirgula multivorans]SNS71290.1 sortase A [Anaerovirgula multivorans]
MKKLSYLFIVLGILIASYPKLSDTYSSYWQARLLAELEADSQQQEELIEDNYRQLNQVFEEEREALTVEDDTEINTTNNQQEKKNTIEAIGTIEIEKINLRLPIVEGTSNTALKRGAGHLAGTNSPGEIGNVAIAAHRGHTYGQLFNRLDELEVGDRILIQTNNTKYQYTVYEKKVVEPADISVLNRNNANRVLTLITCDPLYDATHRLIIHAKID